jgi:hypothetical protein
MGAESSQEIKFLRSKSPSCRSLKNQSFPQKQRFTPVVVSYSSTESFPYTRNAAQKEEEKERADSIWKKRSQQELKRGLLVAPK